MSSTLVFVISTRPQGWLWTRREVDGIGRYLGRKVSRVDEGHDVDD